MLGCACRYVTSRRIHRGETILIERTITELPDGMHPHDSVGLMVSIANDQSRLVSLMQDMQTMVPSTEDTPDELNKEASSVMLEHGVELTPEVLRMFAVFRHNAFEGQ